MPSSDVRTNPYCYRGFSLDLTVRTAGTTQAAAGTILPAAAAAAVTGIST